MSDSRSEGPPDTPQTGWLEDGWPPCARAQADGVPCQELDRDCEECQRAFPQMGRTELGWWTREGGKDRSEGTP